MLSRPIVFLGWLVLALLVQVTYANHCFNLIAVGVHPPLIQCGVTDPRFNVDSPRLVLADADTREIEFRFERLRSNTTTPVPYAEPELWPTVKTATIPLLRPLIETDNLPEIVNVEVRHGTLSSSSLIGTNSVKKSVR